MLVCELSNEMNTIELLLKLTEIMVRENKKGIFYKHLLNMNNSLTIPSIPLKFSAFIHEIQMQRGLSHPFLCRSFLTS